MPSRRLPPSRPPRAADRPVALRRGGARGVVQAVERAPYYAGHGVCVLIDAALLAPSRCSNTGARRSAAAASSPQRADKTDYAAAHGCVAHGGAMATREALTGAQPNASGVRRAGPVDRQRRKRNGDRGGMLVLAGASGNGKSTAQVCARTRRRVVATGVARCSWRLRVRQHRAPSALKRFRSTKSRKRTRRVDDF